LADCPEGLEALALICCEFEPSKRPIAQTCVDELEILLNEYGNQIKSFQSYVNSFSNNYL
jgi:hypothetical protein